MVGNSLLPRAPRVAPVSISFLTQGACPAGRLRRQIVGDWLGFSTLGYPVVGASLAGLGGPPGLHLTTWD